MHLAGAAMACEEALRRSRHHILAGIERREFATYQRMYRAAGLGEIVAARSLLAFHLPGCSWHWQRQPPSRLRRASHTRG